MEKSILISVALAGITTGGLSCFAVQGGLLTSAIAQARKNQESGHSGVSDIIPLTAFISAKLIAYTIIGGALGAFGSFFSFNAAAQASVQILIGIYMLGVGANLLNVHPFFRYFIFQPPYVLQKFIRKTIKNGNETVTPVVLGLMTLFIPCGTTLAMEALAISTQSPIEGAAIMATFVLSSSWVFVGLGILYQRLTGSMQSMFYKITAAVLVILAVISINSGLNLLSMPLTLNTFAANQKAEGSPTKNPQLIEYELQKVSVIIDSRGYTPSTRFLKKGIPVELTLESRNSYSCANAFAIPTLNILKVMPENGIEKISFTPNKAGRLVYSCSMGMFRGEFIVE